MGRLRRLLVPASSRTRCPRATTPARCRPTVRDGRIEVSVEHGRGVPRRRARPSAHVSGPDGQSIEVQLERTAAGRFEGSADAPRPGSYAVGATVTDDGRRDGAEQLDAREQQLPGRVRTRRADAAYLARLAAATGGRVSMTPRPTCGTRRDWHRGSRLLAPARRPAARGRPAVADRRAAQPHLGPRGDRRRRPSPACRRRRWAAPAGASATPCRASAVSTRTTAGSTAPPAQTSRPANGIPLPPPRSDASPAPPTAHHLGRPALLPPPPSPHRRRPTRRGGAGHARRPAGQASANADKPLTATVEGRPWRPPTRPSPRRARPATSAGARAR